MQVDRCICFDVSFKQLNDYVEAHGGSAEVDLEKLQQQFHCGCGCGLCVPYLKAMLRTGKTEFPLIPPSSQSLP